VNAAAVAPQDYRERRISAQDGLRLFLRDFGDPLAPEVPLLCLSGLARNSKDFIGFARRHAARRRVVCPDYRGRGQSDYDAEWRNYRPEVYLRDLATLLAACNLHRVIVCGTSMGGLLAMGLAVSNPIVLAGVILNDVGPALETQAVGRIRDHIARDQPLADWAAASAEAKRLHAELGYGEDEAKWRRFVEATYRQGPDGRLRVDWDVRIARTLGGQLPDLWPFFRAIRRLPALAIRGSQSSVLTAKTFAAMLAEKPDLLQVTVPDVGHAPALDEAEAEQAIDDFVAGIDS